MPCCSPIVGTGLGQPLAPVTQCLHVIASCPAVGQGGLIWAQGCSIDPPAQAGCVAAAPGLSLLLVLLGCCSDPCAVEMATSTLPVLAVPTGVVATFVTEVPGLHGAVGVEP